MLLLRVLVWVFAVQFASAGDDLSDFSNNLAQDLGPLIALFGEPITRQYLSESTTFLDYFIFAVCPLGIITAIVSVIRVCGHSSLRAFIGRSQEGNGVVEAELCTSTSRDVCELFNQGGITRVLGQPNVLELVCVSPKAQKPSQETEGHRVFLFQHYLQAMEEQESEWKKLDGSFFTSSDTRSGPSNGFAPKPNLSLNIGIKRQPLWVFLLVAMTGLVLQIGILFLAGFGAWTLDWTLYHPTDAVYEDYAPRMFIAGTILLSIGMWSCAALVGHATQEISYKRRANHSPSAQQSRLLWLQPGPQVIGDQSFDPFSHFENRSKPLRYWTSSRKGNANRLFAWLTFLAGICTIVGYVLQFIGLRGLKAWVSIAQLTTTLIMSFLRGLLRMQRFGNDDNQLAKMPDLVSRHELDWMAFEIARPPSSVLEQATSSDSYKRLSSFVMRFVKGSSTGVPATTQSMDKTPGRSRKASYWHITGQCAAATRSISQDGSLRNFLTPQNSSLTEQRRPERLGSLSAIQTQPKMPDAYRHLLATRVRLAHLTGHFVFEQLEESEYQSWKDDLVRVRVQAKLLSAAIEGAIQSLIPDEKRNEQRDIDLRIKAITCSVSSGDCRPHEHEVIVAVRAPGHVHTTQSGWKIDSAQVEALLGLWMWSLISDERLIHEDESSNLISFAERRGGEAMHIIFAGYDDDSWDGERTNMKDEMSLWLGSKSIEFPEYVLHMDEEEASGNNDLWTLRTGSSDALEKLSDLTSTTGHTPKRLFGWNIVYSFLSRHPNDNHARRMESGGPGKRTTLKVLCLPRKRSLLDICTQELFVALIASFLKSGEILIPNSTIEESQGNIQMNNRAVDDIAKAFVENGLGTRSDALLCITPSLRSEFYLGRSSMILELTTGADTYRRRGQWDRAERLLRWACQMYSPPGNHTSELDEGPHGRSTLEWIMRKTAELYRWSLANTTSMERQTFAKDGIDWMSKFLVTLQHTRSHSASPLSEVGTGSSDELLFVAAMIQRYKDVADKVLKESYSPPDTTSSHPSCLVQAIRERERTLTLYHLCFVNSQDFGSKALQPALPLAVRNNWREVVEVILEMKGSPDSQDEEGRTAASHCAELGHWWYLRTLEDHGAFFDRVDNAGRTPLHWAAQSGQIATCEDLLDSQQVDRSAADRDGQTPLWTAITNCQWEVVDLLLRAGVSVEESNKSGQTPLSWAAEKGNDAITRKLVDYDADLNHTDAKGQTPLYLAAEKKHASTVSILVDEGANVNVGNNIGWTPLMMAAEYGYEVIVRKLLDASAEVGQADALGRSALSRAAGRGRYEIAKQLLASGAEIDQCTKKKRTPMSCASEKGYKNVAGLLLDKGAEVDAADDGGRTSLSWAAEHGHEDVASILIDKGANVKHIDGFGTTPLILAAGKGHTAVVSLLLRRGAHVTINHQVGSYRTSALSEAAMGGFEGAVEQLLLYGAEVDIEDRSNRTPLSFAAEKGREAVIKVLLDNGADVNHVDDSGYTAVNWAEKRWQGSATKLLMSRGGVAMAPRV